MSQIKVEFKYHRNFPKVLKADLNRTPTPKYVTNFILGSKYNKFLVKRAIHIPKLVYHSENNGTFKLSF